MNLNQFVAELADRGVKLWVSGGEQLRFRAPKGALTPELRDLLALHKAELVKLLQHSNANQHDTSIPLVRVEIPGNLPLSFAQERMWFLSQLEPNNPFYNELQALRLHGSLNVVALEKSLNKIIQRHEALRTNFATVDGQPVQVIAESLTLSVPLVDLQDLHESEREISGQRLATAEAQQPFDFASSPLIRAALLKLTEVEHILLLTIHHIVFDGWSWGIILRELATIYSAFCHDLSPELPSLPIQYKDFAVWQRQWLREEVLSSQLAYWKQQLSGAPALLELPTDRVRPSTQTYRGAHQRFALSRELTEALMTLSHSSGVTLFVTLLAAFQTLLYRYTGQTDICVGTPHANRDRPEIGGLIGFFVNTLVLRTDMSGNPRFEDVLYRVRDVALGAYAHQDLPFAKLVEELQIKRDLSYTPLVQVMLAFHNVQMPQIQMEGLTVSELAVESATAKFDLTLSLTQTASGLIGEWEYNTDLFDATTISRMVGHFQTLLEGIVTNPEQRVSELPLLTEREQHRLLIDWNNTTKEYPLDKCIHQLFEEQVTRSPDAIAVVFEEFELTYRELNQRANRIAHHLKTLGVGPEVLVGICVERSLEMVVGLLAILKAGGAYLALDPNYPYDRLLDMLSDSQVGVLLTQQHLVNLLPHNGAQVVCLDSDWEKIGTQSQENPTSEVKPENLAYVIYTSGSTGKPKGVAIEHRALVNYTQGALVEYRIKSGDRVLQFASISFDGAADEIYPCLSSGGTLVLRTEEMLISISTLLQKCRELQLTVLNFPTAYWHQLTSELARTNESLPASVRLVIMGGERVLPEKLKQWQTYVGDMLHCRKLVAPPMLLNVYGPSETTVVATICNMTELIPEDTRREVPIGRPIANVQVYILDKYLQPVPIGVLGEVYIGGVGLAREYLNRSNLTAEKFIQNPFNKSERLYKTGDCARYLPDGLIECRGRIDNQVKIRGFRVELGEIEALLVQHPSVRASAVVAREDQPGNKQLVAYIVPNNPSNIQHQLRSFLKKKLPDYMIPSFFVMLEELPWTPNDKIDYRALPAPCLSNESDRFVPPSTPYEEIVAGIWSDVLLLKQVGIHDNFFELGGHSLKAVQVMSRLREKFQVDLPLRSLFEEPTVAGVAAAIDSILQTGTSATIATNTQSDLNAEAVLDPTIQPQTVPFAYTSEPKSIFLTGSTGFLGAYLLYELLEQTQADVYCLIRSQHVEQAKQKLQSKLESYKLWKETFSSRIIPVIGDLSKNLLGLSASQFRHLASQIDLIYHNGAWVNVIYPYSILKQANVLGTQEVLRLACEIKLKPVHYISTLSVFSSPAYSEAKIVQESDPLEYSQGLEGGYPQSKWVAEKLVMRSRDRGLPVCIYRPARILGHSQTGICNTDDFLCRMIKGCIQLGMRPKFDGMADNIIPVDYISQAIVHLSRQKESLGKAFHLVNPHLTPMNELFNWINASGYPLEEVSYEKWRLELMRTKEVSSENVLQPLLPIFSQEMIEEAKEPEYDYTNTLFGLAGTDIVFPTIEQKILEIYFSYFINSGFLPAPPFIKANK